MGGLSSQDGLDGLGLPAGLDDASSELESDTSDDSENVPLGCGSRGAANEIGAGQRIEVRDVAVDEVRVVERIPDEVGGCGGLGAVASLLPMQNLSNPLSSGTCQ